MTTVWKEWNFGRLLPTKSLMFFSFILLIVFYFVKPTLLIAPKLSRFLATYHHTTLKIT